jgi:nucleotide-binding universal stress UspA family protein
MMARDGEMPKGFLRLNAYGVPRWPLIISVLFPLLVTMVVPNLETLASLYAIGVVGAIAVNLGSCTFNRHMKLAWHERLIMGITFLVLFAVEATVAWDDEHALFFAVLVVATGLTLRAYSQRRAGLRTLTVSEDIAAAVAPETSPGFRLNLAPTQTILVAARGVTPVLRFALDEARLRQATLYVLYVKELAVTVPGPLTTTEAPRWQHDRQAREIMYTMLAMGKQASVTVIPLYAVSEDPASTILDQAATMGADLLILGSRHRRTLASILKGDVVTAVANNLPENIQLILYG